MDTESSRNQDKSIAMLTEDDGKPDEKQRYELITSVWRSKMFNQWLDPSLDPFLNAVDCCSQLRQPSPGNGCQLPRIYDNINNNNNKS